MRTAIHLFAIAGLGLVLGTGHAIFRTAALGKPAVTLKDPVQSNPGGAPGNATTNTDPIPDTVSDPAPDPISDPKSPESDQPSGQDTTPAVSPLDAPVYEGQITLREASELFEQGAIFLDARNEDDFNAGHIEGAIWMPAARANTREGQKDLDFIPPGEIVVIYCTGGDCDASKNTQRRMTLLQYDFDVRILGKGYVDWVEVGLPVTIPGSDDADDGGTP